MTHNLPKESTVVAQLATLTKNQSGCRYFIVQEILDRATRQLNLRHLPSRSKAFQTSNGPIDISQDILIEDWIGMSPRTFHNQKLKIACMRELIDLNEADIVDKEAEEVAKQLKTLCAFLGNKWQSDLATLEAEAACPRGVQVPLVVVERYMKARVQQ
jgi:hypothetical protein